MKFFTIAAVSAILLLSVLPSDARPRRPDEGEVMDGHHHYGGLNACQLCLYHLDCLCNCGHVCGNGGDDYDARAADDDERCNGCLRHYGCEGCRRQCDNDD